MTPHAVADMLEGYALEVLELPGVSRTRPHAFVEAKSELRGKILRKVAELRTVPAGRPALAPKPVFRPGVRTIGCREVQVEVKRRA